MPEYLCPYCKQPTYDDDALRCISCGNFLNRKIGFMSNIRHSGVVAVIVIVALLSFIALFIMQLK